MTIPEIRASLYRLAEFAEWKGRMFPSDVMSLAEELRKLADATRRRPAVRRAPVKNRRLTPREKSAIRREFRADPDAHLQDLAARFNVNIGRVSEVVNGRRT
jgi:hypothetical protein